MILYIFFGFLIEVCCFIYDGYIWIDVVVVFVFFDEIVVILFGGKFLIFF